MFFKSLVIKALLACLATTMLSGTTASAQQITKADIRQFIANQDYETLDTLLATQKDAVDRGVVTQDEQRLSYDAFTITDPKVHDFVEQWLHKMPNSPYAHTAQAWIDFTIAWLIRGVETGRRTHQAAHQSFRQLHERGMEHALKAYALDKTYVPATDAIFSFGVVMDTPKPPEEYLADIMDVSPNYGSLRRAFWTTNPNWGGRWADAENLCETFAARVPNVEGYTVDICKFDASMAANHHENIQSFHLSQIGGLKHEMLQRYATKVAIHLVRGDLDIDRRARAQVEADDFHDIELIFDYDRNIARRHGWPVQSLNVHERRLAYARKEIVHDPYNKDLLRSLGAIAAWDQEIPRVPTYEERIDYAERSLAFQPYSGRAWGNLYRVHHLNWSEDAPFIAAPMLVNAIVFSNYRPRHVYEQLRYTFNFVSMLNFMEVPNDEVTEQERQTLLRSVLGQTPRTDLICPAIRAYRVWENICEYSSDDRWCQIGSAEKVAYDSVVEDANASNMCPVELHSPIEDLYYQPVAVEFGFTRG